MPLNKNLQRKKDKEYRSRKYISKEEFNKLYNGRAKGKRESEKRIFRHKAILSLLYHHGLRRAELCELKWGAIDWESRTISIHRSKRGKDSIHPLVIGERSLLKRLLELSNSDYIVEGSDGKLTVSAINHFFADLNRRKIISIKVTPHMLRHGCGFYLANKGIDTRTIQVYLGHSSINSTTIYTEISDGRFKGMWD